MPKSPLTLANSDVPGNGVSAPSRDVALAMGGGGGALLHWNLIQTQSVLRFCGGERLIIGEEDEPTLSSTGNLVDAPLSVIMAWLPDSLAIVSKHEGLALLCDGFITTPLPIIKACTLLHIHIRYKQ